MPKKVSLLLITCLLFFGCLETPVYGITKPAITQKIMITQGPSYFFNDVISTLKVIQEVAPSDYILITRSINKLILTDKTIGPSIGGWAEYRTNNVYLVKSNYINMKYNLGIHDNYGFGAVSQNITMQQMMAAFLIHEATHIKQFKAGTVKNTETAELEIDAVNAERALLTKMGCSQELIESMAGFDKINTRWWHEIVPAK